MSFLDVIPLLRRNVSCGATYPPKNQIDTLIDEYVRPNLTREDGFAFNYRNRISSEENVSFEKILDKKMWSEGKKVVLFPNAREWTPFLQSLDLARASSFLKRRQFVIVDSKS